MGDGFYASVQRVAHGKVQTALLLGPHPSYEDADADIPEARRLAELVDDRAVWYAYGVSRIYDVDPLPPGRLNHLRGQPGPEPLVTAYRHNQPKGTPQ